MRHIKKSYTVHLHLVSYVILGPNQAKPPVKVEVIACCIASRVYHFYQWNIFPLYSFPNLISTWMEFYILFLISNLKFDQWWAFSYMLVVVSPYDANHLTDKSYIVFMKCGRTYSDNTVNREFVFKMLSQLFCDKMQSKSSNIKLCQSLSIIIIICHQKKARWV